MRPDGRLTRQGRLARTFLFLSLVIAGVVVGSQAFAEGFEVQGPTDTYTVQSGETLWGIARALAGPEQGTREIVDEILVLNDFESASLHAGEQILIPVSP